MAIESRSYVFDPRPNYPFLITAKRYWRPESPFTNSSDALTLIFAHGTGFHKEQWEPTMDDLWTILGDNKSFVAVREMWSIDAPNHGDAAILNEFTLKQGYSSTFGWEEYARALFMFLTGFGTGVDVDFSTRKLTGIGHSMGAVSLALSLGYSPHLKFENLILCEPMVVNPTFFPKRNLLLEVTTKRKDIWSSQEEAYELLNRRPWQQWDPRVFRKFINEGLRPLPTAEYPDRNDGVTLKCTRIQECACYRDEIGPRRVYDALKFIAKRLRLHLIYGSIHDAIPYEMKMDLVNNSIEERNLASLSYIENAGHLVVQTHPAILAQKIFDALSLSNSSKIAPRL